MRKSKWITAAAALAVVTVVTSAWAGDRTTRKGKVGTVTFRLASNTDQAGFVAQKATNGETVYVSSSDTFGIGDVTDIQTTRARDGQVVSMALAPGVSEQLAMASTKSGASGLAVMRGGRIVALGAIDSIGVNETVITGLATGEVARLSRLVIDKGLAGEAAAVVSVVPQRETVSAGGTVTVDVYVSNVASLRTYQFSLDASGGESGTMMRTTGKVDQTREDFVFGTDQVIQAVDKTHGRFGAVLFRGAKDVTGQKYVGSYTFQASPDASGSFTISVNPTQISFLSDDAGGNIPFHAVSTTVMVR